MANKQSKGQRELLKLILKKRNLPTEAEVFDIYVEFVCKETCSIVNFRGKSHYFENTSSQLKDQSQTWYRSALGDLIIKRKINLVL